MITNENELDAALEEGLGLIGDSRLDRAGEKRLRELLGAIHSYQSKTNLPEEHPLSRRLAVLGRQLEAFQQRWEKDHPRAGPHWSSGFVFPG